MEKKYKIYRFIKEDDFDHSIKELSIKTEYIDGMSFKELLSMFRQFVIMIGYSEETAKMILSLNSSDLEALGIKVEDLSILEE